MFFLLTCTWAVTDLTLNEIPSYVALHGGATDVTQTPLLTVEQQRIKQLEDDYHALLIADADKQNEILQLLLEKELMGKFLYRTHKNMLDLNMPAVTNQLAAGSASTLSTYTRVNYLDNEVAKTMFVMSEGIVEFIQYLVANPNITNVQQVSLSGINPTNITAKLS